MLKKMFLEKLIGWDLVQVYHGLILSIRAFSLFCTIAVRERSGLSESLTQTDDSNYFARHTHAVTCVF